jgi:hypothetical protein
MTLTVGCKGILDCTVAEGVHREGSGDLIVIQIAGIRPAAPIYVTRSSRCVTNGRTRASSGLT